VPASTFGFVRKLRPPAPGGIFHVTAHGIDDRTIFPTDAARVVFLELLGEAVRRHDWICWTYCLMGTHYHIVLETPNGNLSAGMQLLNGRYAQLFNGWKRRRGHVFEARFGSEPVERDEHLNSAIRYVILNPCRAGICKSPAQWPWSSFGAIVGLVPAPSFLAVDRCLALFGRDRARARAAFRAFVRGS
jgi:REP element-mobilizing transposase RayT